MIIDKCYGFVSVEKAQENWDKYGSHLIECYKHRFTRDARDRMSNETGLSPAVVCLLIHNYREIFEDMEKEKETVNG